MNHSPPSRPATWPLVPAVAVLVAALAAVSLTARVTAGQETLACGVPVSRALPAGGTHAYRLVVPPGARAVVQSSDVSGTLGLLRLRVSGPGFAEQTCSGVLEFTGRGNMLLEVSQCNGNSAGTYTATLNVVSDGAGNCGRMLECGATPAGLGFEVSGAVDAFQMPLVEDQEATLQLNYLDVPGSPYLRIYDPEGRMIAERCSNTILSLAFEAEETGIYTALVSACGHPAALPYRVSFHDSTCPSGPIITHFGITDPTGRPVEPSGLDPAGRPIYPQLVGQGMLLVLEARAGADGKRVGETTAVSGDLPDMQAIVSRPLGNGDPAVCDVAPPRIGGVPATVPFAFATTAQATDTVNDMGCRFDDGQGSARGRRSSLDACTRSEQAFGFAFVDRASTIQYCAQIVSAWAFPDGDTLVAARVRNTGGVLGAPREIVIRVEPTTPSPSPTPSRTRTPTPPGPTATPPPAVCTGDCDGDRVVQVTDMTRVVNVAIGRQPVTACPAADPNANGLVTIDEVLVAVGNALVGCP